MRAIVLGLAAATALAAAGLSVAPASALPVPGAAIAPGAAIEQAQYVTRRVVRRGPRCTTVVTRSRGPFGRVVVRRERRCY
ncbi:MAG: hypothetical protein PGN34_13405 [Methylobacterium frigidaeris]